MWAPVRNDFYINKMKPCDVYSLYRVLSYYQFSYFLEAEKLCQLLSDGLYDRDNND